MKQLKYISIISIMALITAPAVADIASAEYVDSVVVKYSTGNTTKAGITKLYTGIGTATDGTMTQSAINTALSNKQDKLPTGPSDGKKYSLIWNGSSFAFEEFTTGGTTGGGSSTSIDWNAISAYIADPVSNPNYTYASYGFAVDSDDYDSTNYCGGSAGHIYDEEWDEHDELWFGVEEGQDCSDTRVAGMVAGDWYYDLPPMNVKIEGRALCSSTPKPSTGGEHPVGDPDGSGAGDTLYCWCKITAPSASRWVFHDSYAGDADFCAYYCANYCASSVRGEPAFRSALFGAIEQ